MIASLSIKMRISVFIFSFVIDARFWVLISNKDNQMRGVKSDKYPAKLMSWLTGWMIKRIGNAQAINNALACLTNRY